MTVTDETDTTDNGPHEFLSRPLLTVAEVASVLRVHEKTVRRMIDEKKLEAVLVGCQYRIPTRALRELLGDANMRDIGESFTLGARR